MLIFLSPSVVSSFASTRAAPVHRREASETSETAARGASASRSGPLGLVASSDAKEWRGKADGGKGGTQGAANEAREGLFSFSRRASVSSSLPDVQSSLEQVDAGLPRPSPFLSSSPPSLADASSPLPQHSSPPSPSSPVSSFDAQFVSPAFLLTLSEARSSLALELPAPVVDIRPSPRVPSLHLLPGSFSADDPEASPPPPPPPPPRASPWAAFLHRHCGAPREGTGESESLWSSLATLWEAHALPALTLPKSWFAAVFLTHLRDPSHVVALLSASNRVYIQQQSEALRSRGAETWTEETAEASQVDGDGAIPPHPSDADSAAPAWASLLPCFAEPFSCHPVPLSLVAAFARYFVSLFPFLLLLVLPVLLLRLVPAVISATLPVEPTDEACFSILSASSAPSSPFHLQAMLFPASPAHSEASSVAASPRLARVRVLCPLRPTLAQAAARRSLTFAALVVLFASVFAASSWGATTQIDASLCAIAHAAEAFFGSPLAHQRPAAASAQGRLPRRDREDSEGLGRSRLQGDRERRDERANRDGRETREGRENREGRREAREGREERNGVSGEQATRNRVEQRDKENRETAGHAFAGGERWAKATRAPCRASDGDKADETEFAAPVDFVGISGVTRQLDAFACAWNSAALAAYSVFFSESDEALSASLSPLPRNARGDSDRDSRESSGHASRGRAGEKAGKTRQDAGRAGQDQGSGDGPTGEGDERRRGSGLEPAKRGEQSEHPEREPSEASGGLGASSTTRGASSPASVSEIRQALASALEIATELETRWAARQRLLSLDPARPPPDEAAACSGGHNGGEQAKGQAPWRAMWRSFLTRLRHLCASAWTCLLSRRGRGKLAETPETPRVCGAPREVEATPRETRKGGAPAEDFSSPAGSSSSRVRRCDMRPHAPRDDAHASRQREEDLSEARSEAGGVQEERRRGNLDADDARFSLVSLLHSRDARGAERRPAAPEWDGGAGKPGQIRPTDSDGFLRLQGGVLRCTDAGRRRRLATFTRQLLVYVQEEARTLRAFVQTHFSPSARRDTASAIADAHDRLELGVAAVELPLLWRNLEWALTQFHVFVTGLLRLSRLTVFLGQVFRSRRSREKQVLSLFASISSFPFTCCLSLCADSRGIHAAFPSPLLPVRRMLLRSGRGSCIALVGGVPRLRPSSTALGPRAAGPRAFFCFPVDQNPTGAGLSTLLAFVPDASPLSPALFRESLSHCLSLPVESPRPSAASAPVSFPLAAESEKLRNFVYQALPPSLRAFFEATEAPPVSFDWRRRTGASGDGFGAAGRNEEDRKGSRQPEDLGETGREAPARARVSLSETRENEGLISELFSAAALLEDQAAAGHRRETDARQRESARTDFFVPWQTLPLGIASKFQQALDRAALHLTREAKGAAGAGRERSGAAKSRRRQATALLASDEETRTERELETAGFSRASSPYASRVETPEEEKARKINLLFAGVLEAAARSDSGASAVTQAVDDLRGDEDGSEWEIVHLWPPLTSTSLLHTSPTDGVNARLPRLLQEMTGDAWAFRGAALPPACADAPVGPLHFPSSELAWQQPEGGGSPDAERKTRERGDRGRERWTDVLRMDGGQPRRCFYVSQDITHELIVSQPRPAVYPAGARGGCSSAKSAVRGA
uniref:Transmembrane protein n=1 Tax=Neospora caninum (strain Liverpool) TaxID=572307 RepID=F0JB09_NEOCL|nr:hypothetical protein, conserved [Neospora caninum Liverpool]CEL71275.1 TPA: hypothetical protein, conserved [Neospora caninum Liverpool]